MIQILSKQSQRAQQKKWKEYKRKQRADVAATQKINQEQVVESIHTAETLHTTAILNSNKLLTTKEWRRCKTKLARENLMLKREIEFLKQSKEKYRKRVFCYQNRTNLTSKSQTNIMVKQCLKQKDVWKKVA